MNSRQMSGAKRKVYSTRAHLRVDASHKTFARLLFPAQLSSRGPFRSTAHFLPIRLSPCHSVLVLIFSAFFFFPHSLPVEAIHSWRRSWSLGFSPVEAILDLLVPTGDAGLSIAAPDSYLKVRLPLASSSYLRFTS